MTHCKNDNPQSCREQPSTQQVMTRHNGLMFYALTAASFLETAIPLHANALLNVFSADPEVQRWIEQNWWPVKCAHARETRTYVEATWPEFDWSSAYGEFYEAYRPLACLDRDGRSLAREALVRSVAAAQATAFYRCLGTAADNADLRRLLYRMSADESGHFACFRRLFARLDRGSHLGLLTTYRTIVTCATRARDVDVQLAFSRLGSPHWYGGAPFSELDYRDFVLRMGEVVRRHLPLGVAQRLLFRPWWQARRLHPPSAPAMRPVPRARALTVRQLQTGALQ
jgi:hypothetical protein